jgi:RimJ/RimL family protein N-acetyltransferase
VGVILQALLLDIPETVETSRLVLRATRAGHGVETSAALEESRPQLRAWMPWARDTQSVEDSEHHCRAMQARWHAREELDFCFFRRGDGVLVGKGGLHTIDWSVPKLELGYWIRTSCTRQGLATEAALALVELARTRLAAHRLEIACDARNVASRRVAAKCGFELEGILRRNRRDTSGELADSCMYARLF